MSKIEKKELVKVENGGVGGALQLNPTAKLTSVRRTLEHDDLMTSDQSFLVGGEPLGRSSEEDTTLSEVLVKPKDGGPAVLTVGAGTVPIGQDPKSSTKMWNLMSSDQKLMVMNTVVQITKGISLDADNGAFKTTHDAIVPLTPESLPSSEVPRIQSSVTTNAYFNKYAESLATSSTDGGSLSVSTPWGGGSTSFSEAQSHASSSSSVKTYFVGSFNVNKVVVELDRTKLQLSKDFYQALLNAAENSSKTNGFVEIVEALNKYGWYVPTNMTLGGMLFTTKTSEVSNWAEADSSSTSFAADFKASFDGIGGGGAYNQSDTTKTSSSGSTGSASLSFTAIGGNPADSNNYSTWATSLEKAIAWNVSSYEKMIPSVALLMNDTSPGENGPQLATYLRNLIADEYPNCAELHTLQPLIDCGDYSLQIQDIIGVWADSDSGGG